MRACLEEYNETSAPDDKKKCMILSMDVKSLYPSLRIGPCMEAVRELVENSDIEVRNIEWWEVQKYVAVFYTPEEIEESGLRSVIPKRQKVSKVTLTMNCLSNSSAKVDHEKWAPCDNPNTEQKKKLLGMAIAMGVKIVMVNHTYSVGDKFYLQTEGGPIGLELTGAISRVFMNSWDKKYLKKVEESDLVMKMYTRYIDDSNQVTLVRDDYNSETHLKKLLEIANSIQEGIVMEADIVENHSDAKLPILDMKCWLDSQGTALYQHFEKPVSSKLVISSRSAHSKQCSRSVHVSEIERRISNTSKNLNWDEYVAPVLTDYMARMKAGGYDENYRKHVLLNGLAVADSKVRKAEAGEVPLNRPAGYRKIERRKEKKEKKKNWGTKGGYLAPIVVPATPNSELAKRLRKKCEQQKVVRFRIVERGGITLNNMLQNSNPTASKECGKEDCFMDNQPEGARKCHKSNVLYEWTCRVCGDTYTGETSRNFYARAKEHLEKSKKSENDDLDSFISNHQLQHHNGALPDFKVKVLKSFKDPLSRQVYEGIYIRRQSGASLNTKQDYYQPSSYRMNRDVNHG